MVPPADMQIRILSHQVKFHVTRNMYHPARSWSEQLAALHKRALLLRTAASASALSLYGTALPGKLSPLMVCYTRC